MVVTARADEPGMFFSGGAAHRFGHQLVSKHDRLVRPHDSGFLEPDRFRVVSEPLAVIQRYIGNQACIGFDRIHRVQPAAHPYFQDCRVHLPGLEYRHGRQGTELEVRQRNVSARRFDPLERGHYLLVTCGHSVDTDALVVLQHVRRHVGTDTSR